MKNKFLPKTRKGSWAVGLFAAFFALGIVGNRISSMIGNTIEYPNPINSPLLGSIIYLAFGAAISASIVGLVAIIGFGIANLIHGTIE